MRDGVLLFVSHAAEIKSQTETVSVWYTHKSTSTIREFKLHRSMRIKSFHATASLRCLYCCCSWLLEEDMGGL